ncbi:serine carboxypeptidase [Viridothelium virens]|uniref:Carboxypeptidase n=1 Tax=Viridothelium virens TaxID=1048519 RepID=A0A6A6H8M4_VIRVR|nr:serine carboxypeptidase [Viridothelium virens]
MKSIFLSLSVLISTAVGSHPRDAFTRAKPRDASPGLITNLGARTSAPQHVHKRASYSSPYLNNNTEQFVVNGTAIPDIPFDIGESYAGLLPISDQLNETRKLYFWFFPSQNPNATDEITIWFNGGPGCSSLTGLIHENGPILWQTGTQGFTKNSYTFVNLTNMVYVEQPVGVGFTQGTPDISNEVELGQQFVGFWKNFMQAFQLEQRKVYITGESYAGYYIPYVADAFITQNDDEYYNLKGVAINDPIIGDNTVQQDVILSPYVDYWSNIFNFNETFTNYLHSLHSSCGYASYISKYLTYPPPPGPFPVPPDPEAVRNSSCATWDIVYDAINYLNPCFNVYHITDYCPLLYNPEIPYFNRLDVQAAINAPVGTVWQQCTNTNVFPPTGDQSLGAAQDGVLQRVIEHNNNTIIGVGNLDYILPTNGTLLALQNVTWNGVQGFQSYPGSREVFVPYHTEYNQGSLAASGYVGRWGQERGLAFYQVDYAGHQQPQYAPGSSYRVIELLLGRIDALDQPGSFSTQ